MVNVSRYRQVFCGREELILRMWSDKIARSQRMAPLIPVDAVESHGLVGRTESGVTQPVITL